MIIATEFQPFSSRVGIDTVVKLVFPYDADLIAELKSGIAEARRTVGGRNLGGWVPAHKAWFVEHQAWPVVRKWLESGGWEISQQFKEAKPKKKASSEPVNSRSIIDQWRREMALRFHPDRGGSHEAMKAVNEGYDRLVEMLNNLDRGRRED